MKVDMKNILLIALLGIAFVSCDSFLDEPIEKSSAKTLETAEELDALIGGLEFEYESEPDFFCTDNFELPLSLHSEIPGLWDRTMTQQYVMSSFYETSNDGAWNDRYETIWSCNLAIKSVEEGNLSGNEALLAKLKAEAHFIRAMEYFFLVINYCLHPTAANENEPGLPLRTGTDAEENLSRASLKETYDFIEADLSEALKVDVGFDRNWRISTAAINAFAARYYLYRGDFEQASNYANLALSEYDEMVNYETEIFTVDQFDAEYPMTYEYNLSKEDSRSLNFWKGQYLHRLKQNPRENTVPSQDLLDLYNPADKRYEMFAVEGYFKRFGGLSDTPLGFVQGGRGTYLSGPSTSEMFLIRAEVKARNNDFTGAMEDIEQVRMNRFAASDYVPLSIPGDKKSAIELVVDERRREMPFTCRWYDIRRLNVDSETDDIVIHRTFYPVDKNGANTNAEPVDYIIESNSRLYARPLSSSVINLSNGQTKQNEY